jgi:hypothetical protein
VAEEKVQGFKGSKVQGVKREKLKTETLKS